MTIDPGRTTPPTRAAASRPASDPAGFAPGTIFAGRYRIVAVLGKGGMGEVVRADDLTLGQSVALKFLPARVAGDPGRLDSFLAEVRLARQVSHPNVCRVYDIGQADGLHYLSMEYIDGEDLASLLRRIGRLPGDKATEIARQLCAGLAAAHERGILHRDLKPANVMIDGRGRVRITDFGLAGLAAEARTGGTSGGTPAYMAPEQIAGAEVTERSDIYALGLVLYEVYTGEPAFRAETFAELGRLHRESSPSRPSSHVADLDPAAERVILRCLEKDPRERPPSAMAVAAALPGGDALAAALAAGETPSPELVAASGAVGGLRPAVGWACLAAIVAGMIAIAYLNARVKLFERVPLAKPPAVLAERAREILMSLGQTGAPRDEAYGFVEDGALIEHVANHDRSRERWAWIAAGRPAAIRFWYRGSPRTLIAEDVDGRVSWNDPAPLVPGMATVLLDTEGRLLEYRVVPPDYVDEGEAPGPPDWSELLRAAALDPGRLTPASPRWTPPAYADARAAWSLADSAVPGGSLWIEAAACRGQPSFFLVTGPWHRPQMNEPEPRSGSVRAAKVVETTMILAMLGGAALLAVRNLRLGRGDRRSAFRLAAYIFVVNLLGWLLAGSHVPDAQEEIGLFIKALGPALFFSGSMWLIYLALEPYVRRRFPHRLIAWSRLCAGRFRDPLVGRDVLVGVTTGIVLALVYGLGHLLPGWLGALPPRPGSVSMSVLLGLRFALGALLSVQSPALFNGLFFLFMPVLLQVLLRKHAISVAAFFVILTAIFTFRSPQPEIHWAENAILVGALIGVMLRYGLLALAASFCTVFLVGSGPITTDLSSWYAAQSLLLMAAVLALAVYGFVVAAAGRPLLGTGLLRE